MVRRSITLGFVAVALLACGDDGGSATSSGGTSTTGGSEATTVSTTITSTTIDVTSAGMTTGATTTDGTTTAATDTDGTTTGAPTCQEDEDCMELDADLCTVPTCTMMACEEVDMVCPAGCTNGVCDMVTVKISELLYNETGLDNNVFIELHGPGGFDLSGLELEGINGNDGQIYGTLSLVGQTIPADGLFVIVDTDATDAPLIAVADMMDPFADLQNSPDSVRLRIAGGGAVVDAVGYGSSFGMNFAGEGLPAPDVTQDNSLARIGTFLDTDDNSVDFFEDDTPSPGALND